MKMKMIIGLVCIAAIGALAAPTITVTNTISGTTNWWGFAKATRDSGPAATSAVWDIIRVIKDADGNIVSVMTSRGEAGRYKSVYTNYLNETYE